MVREREDPITKAFTDLIQEIYWTETLEEAEEILARHLEEMDEDLRSILLERRKKICENPEYAIEVIRLQAASDLADTELTAKLLLAKSLISAGFLMQCTPTWSKLSPREKARILAPLYKASYGLDLAVKKWPSSVDERHLDYSLNMMQIAYERAEALGIVEELSGYLEKVAEKLASKLDE